MSLSPELEGLIVPSKYYGIAAVGRPAIFVGDEHGEIAQMLSRTRSGHSVSPGQGAALANLVEQLAEDPERVQMMGRNARAAFDESYDLARALSSWTELLDAVSAEKANAARAAERFRTIATQSAPVDGAGVWPGPAPKIDPTNPR